MSKTELTTTIANHLKQSGQTPTDQELTDCVDNLVSFFEILIEADKKLMKANDPDNRNPDNPD